MRNLKFKYAKAENFLCFGEEGIEINFEQYGSIVCIKGKNLDVNNEDGTDASSNGSGKSSIPEIIVYALYGKTVKKPKKLSHHDIINNKSGNSLMVELIWDKYRLIRTRTTDNKGTLRLWESEEGIWNKDTEITVGGIPTTQKKVEEKVGLTYESFINIFIFSDDNTLSFLECDNTKKREIVENILSLEKYSNYSQSAKDLLKALKDKIKDLIRDYESLDSQKDSATATIVQVEKQEKDWYSARKKELDILLNEIKNKRDELEQSKTGSALAIYQEAQEQISELKLKIPSLEDKRDSLNELINETIVKLNVFDNKITENDNKYRNIKLEYEECEKIVDTNTKIIKDVMSKTNKECPYCLNFVDESNFKKIVENAEVVLQSQIPIFEEFKNKYETVKNQKIKLAELKKKVDAGIIDFKSKLGKINSEISEAHCVISKLSKIEKPDSAINELVLYEQIESLKKQSLDKQVQLQELSPFEDIKQTAIADLTNKIKGCNDKKDEIKYCEDDVLYYDFWVKAFGDTGIRKYIIDGIIPTLNDQIEYWLQYLIDNKIKLTFNNELEETIDRYPFNGRPYIYHGMSGGQRRRLSLTVAAAWAFISALNSGAAPSVIFLDEVTMNMDIIGIHGIYRMICELAKEKQVFVIDHNETLLQMLGGSDTICLEMQCEISKKVLDVFVNN